jgi:hypothetical protein
LTVVDVVVAVDAVVVVDDVAASTIVVVTEVVVVSPRQILHGVQHMQPDTSIIVRKVKVISASKTKHP